MHTGRRGRTRAAGLAVLLALAVAPVGAAPSKPKKPELDLRILPRMAFAPVNVFLTGELKGGDDVEEMYCPELEWDWDDGGKSVHEADCPPFETGTKIERRFTEEHEYKQSGAYSIKLTLRRGGKTLAAQTVHITVRPGLGDRGQDGQPE